MNYGIIGQHLGWNYRLSWLLWWGRGQIRRFACTLLCRRKCTYYSSGQTIPQPESPTQCISNTGLDQLPVCIQLDTGLKPLLLRANNFKALTYFPQSCKNYWWTTSTWYQKWPWGILPHTTPNKNNRVWQWQQWQHQFIFQILLDLLDWNHQIIPQAWTAQKVACIRSRCFSRLEKISSG